MVVAPTHCGFSGSRPPGGAGGPPRPVSAANEPQPTTARLIAIATARTFAPVCRCTAISCCPPNLDAGNVSAAYRAPHTANTREPYPAPPPPAPPRTVPPAPPHT